MEQAERYPARPEFGVGFRGYDRAQVDSFVAESAGWSERAWARINELTARVSELEADPNAIRRARDEAEHTIQDAREKVELLVEELESKAAEVERTLASGAKPDLDELRRSLEYLEQQRSSRHAELSRMRESLSSLADGLPAVQDHERGDARASGDTAQVPAVSEGGPAPEAGPPSHGGPPSDVSSPPPAAVVRQPGNQ